MVRNFIFCALFVLSTIGRAEYRAFELLITNSQTGKTRTVRSTLDQGQYPQYYYLSALEVIEPLGDWMCYERSDYFKPICDRPAAPSNP